MADSRFIVGYRFTIGDDRRGKLAVFTDPRHVTHWLNDRKRTDVWISIDAYDSADPTTPHLWSDDHTDGDRWLRKAYEQTYRWKLYRVGDFAPPAPDLPDQLTQASLFTMEDGDG